MFWLVPRRSNVTNLLKTKEMIKHVTGKYNNSQKKYHAENLYLSRLNNGPEAPRIYDHDIGFHDNEKRTPDA